MDIPDVHLHRPFSSTPSLSSTRPSNRHFFSISNRSWLVGDKITQQILSVIEPTEDSENRRNVIIHFLQALVAKALGAKMFACGSGPLKTYLPHGDIDLTAISGFENGNVLAEKIRALLEHEEKNRTFLVVRNVICVPAKVKVVKCTVSNIAVDISFNQKGGLSTVYFLEQVDKLIGRESLFKRSVLLIKAWCYYESRLLGGFCGLLATYALETMVLHVINLFHSDLYFPLGVLYKFLEYYSTFDWDRYGIAANGRILKYFLPRIKVVPSPCWNKLLITEDFLRNSKKAFFSSTNVVGAGNFTFEVKFLNILDPLRDDNNLGRCVSKGNFFRIKRALSYGAQQLRNILTLPRSEIGAGLEKFFCNTIERNGNGRRVDVLIPVAPYGSESSITNLNNAIPDVVEDCLWSENYELPYLQGPGTSTPYQIWNNGWYEVSEQIPYDQNPGYYMTESRPSSNDTPTYDVTRGTQVNNATHIEERWNPSGAPFVNSSRGSCWRPRGSISPFGTTGDARHNNPITSIGETSVPRGTASSVIFNDRHRLNYSASGSSKWISKETHAAPFYRPVQENLTIEEREKEHENRKEEESNVLQSNIFSGIGESSCSINLSVDNFPSLPRRASIPIVRPSPVAYTKGGQVKERSVSLESAESGSLKPTSPTLSEAGRQSDSDGTVFLDSLSEFTIAISEEDKDSSEIEEKMVVEPLQLTDEREFPPLAPREVSVVTEFPPLRAAPGARGNITPEEVRKDL